jgi:hypothetical protein
VAKIIGRLLIICLVLGFCTTLTAQAVYPMPKDRPIEAIPKPGFNQKGWTYDYTWTGSDYYLELWAADGKHYKSSDRFETMADAYEWVKQFIADKVPFKTLPEGIESMNDN